MTRIVMGTRWQALRRAQEIRWLEKRAAERARQRQRRGLLADHKGYPFWMWYQ